MSVELQRGFSARWTAPEILNEGPYSKEADTFSFAMVMIEVRHGKFAMCRIFKLTSVSYQCRYSQARSRLAVIQPSPLFHP